MFGNMQLTVIKFPSGRFGFVGSIPTELGYRKVATKADVMGCRTHQHKGSSYVWQFPSFHTSEDAVAYAKHHGFDAANC